MRGFIKHDRYIEYLLSEILPSKESLEFCQSTITAYLLCFQVIQSLFISGSQTSMVGPSDVQNNMSE